MKKFNGIAAGLLSGLMLAGELFAAHPLVTDDTGTHGPGRYQLEINGETGFDRQKRDSGQTKTAATQVAAIVSAGIGDTADLIVGIPWQWIREKENDSPSTDIIGAGDTSLELKWRFFQRDGFSLAIKPGITIPTGDESRGLGNGRISAGVTMIATMDMSPVIFNLNASYFRNEYGREVDRQSSRCDMRRASLAVQGEVAKNVQLAGEAGLESSSDRTSRTWPAIVTGGVIYSLRENVDLDIGVRAGLNDPAPDLVFLAGMSIHF